MASVTREQRGLIRAKNPTANRYPRGRPVWRPRGSGRSPRYRYRPVFLRRMS